MNHELSIPETNDRHGGVQAEVKLFICEKLVDKFLLLAELLGSRLVLASVEGLRVLFDPLP